MTGRVVYGEGMDELMIQSVPNYLPNMVEAVFGHVLLPVELGQQSLFIM